MRHRLAILALPVLAMTLLVAAAPAQAGDEAPREYRVKAAFVQRFLEFVAWTNEHITPDGPMRIGVVGDSPMEAALQDLTGDPGVGRELLLCSADELAENGYGVVYVAATIDGLPRNEHPVWNDLHDLSSGILTIGEDPGFHLSGGVINFFAQGDRLRFSVSERAATGAGLKISSKLMRLALIVD
ncbi:MAG: YfiR family protein [bacterium]|nr:YfiR family protein [bacterium]